MEFVNLVARDLHRPEVLEFVQLITATGGRLPSEFRLRVWRGSPESLRVSVALQSLASESSAIIVQGLGGPLARL